MSAWSEERLKVPPGHPLAGEPMKLPDYGVAFISAALLHRESLLCIAPEEQQIRYLCGAVAGDPGGTALASRAALGGDTVPRARVFEGSTPTGSGSSVMG